MSSILLNRSTVAHASVKNIPQCNPIARHSVVISPRLSSKNGTSGRIGKFGGDG
jgi:hypothetical protein